MKFRIFLKFECLAKIRKIKLLTNLLCVKAAPRGGLRQSQFTVKTPVKSSSTSTLGRFAGVDAVEPDLQLFHDALAVHGMSPCHLSRAVYYYHHHRVACPKSDVAVPMRVHTHGNHVD